MNKPSKLTILWLMGVIGIANPGVAQIIVLDTLMFSPSLNLTKDVRIILPPGYHQHTNTYYPVVYYLHGWTGNHTSDGAIVSSMNLYMNNGTIQPFIMVKPNSYCDPFQGSQYTNSPLWGNYQDYVTTDLIAWVDSTFRTVPQKNYRGLLGQSMGSYGCLFLPIAHPDLYIASVGHAGGGSYYHHDSLINSVTLNQLPSGPPYFYNYNSSLSYVRGWFLLAGAFVPNPNTPQTYINPPIVDYPFDEYGQIIDTTWTKMHSFSAEATIHQLSPADSVHFLLSCGTQDDYYQFDPMLDLVDTMLSLGLSVEWMPHTGTHAMPAAFRHRALIFLDSLLGDPMLIMGRLGPRESQPLQVSYYPNPAKDIVQLEVELRNHVEVEINLVNIQGVSSTLLQTRHCAKGKHAFNLNVGDVEPGFYLLHLRAGNRQWFDSLIVY